MPNRMFDDGIDRFNIPAQLRIPTFATFSGLIGLVKGSIEGYRFASDKYVVENAYRLPTNRVNWYNYYKRKHIISTKESIRQGFKSSFKYSLLVTGFLSFEAALDYTRDQIDLLNTISSSIIFALGYSRVNDLSNYATKKVLKRYVAFGFVYGLIQDLLRKYKNGDVWYLRYI